MNILVVEDDTSLANALEAILNRAGYQVDVVYDGNDAQSYALASEYDVIVLDVMIPKKSGLEVARDLRRAGLATPIIMLTAKSQLADKVAGLDSGADDYLTKPFAPQELLARIRALTRRVGEVVFEEITAGDIALNIQTYELRSTREPSLNIRLSQKEFQILQILMGAGSAITSKEALISKVWGVDSTAEDNNVEAYISFLRKKLEFVESQMHIQTIRRVGYVLTEADREGK